MKVKLYRYKKGRDYPEDDSRFIDFLDRTDEWNCFADCNYLTSFEIDTGDEIFCQYLTGLFKHTLKFGDKTIDFNSRVFVRKHGKDDQEDYMFLDKLMKNAEKFVESKITGYKNIKSDIIDLLPMKTNQSIFIETEDKTNEYVFMHQFQWILSRKDEKTYSYSSNLIPLASMIRHI